MPADLRPLLWRDNVRHKRDWPGSWGEPKSVAKLREGVLDFLLLDTVRQGSVTRAPAVSQ